MIEWKTCPRCKTPMELQPVSPIFDKDGSKYGLMFKCSTCSYYSPDTFYSLKDVELLQEEKDSSYISTVQGTHSTTKQQQQRTENGIVQGRSIGYIYTILSSVGLSFLVFRAFFCGGVVLW